MITSAENRGWPGDVEIDDPGAAGLPAPSLIQTAKSPASTGAMPDVWAPSRRSRSETPWSTP
jgi:hypothetical protein